MTVPTDVTPLPASEASFEALGPDRLLELLYWMKLHRAVEDRIVALYKQGEIVGGVYTGHGHEAIGVAGAIDLEPDDVIFPSHRDLGAFLVKGMTPGAVFAQYLGRIDGPTRGRDGNLHMGDWSLGIGAFVSHMADTVPVATGVALSFKLRGEPQVVLCYNGDGATSRGDWHEGLNLAAVLRVPVVFVCVNNQWAYSTPLSRQMSVDRVADRGAAYGIPGVRVDGNDVLAVHAVMRDAIERARSGDGPTLIECVTWRMTGHSHADRANYVSPEFFEEGRRMDPILRYEAWLHERGVLDDDRRAGLAERIRAEVETGVEFGKRSPLPAGEETLLGVFAEPPE